MADLDKRNLFLAQYILELSITDFKFAKIRPSLLAAASLYLVHKIRKLHTAWCDDLVIETNF